MRYFGGLTVALFFWQIYSGRSQSEARRYQELPPSPTEPRVGAVFSPPVQETPINIPDIAPMRRGRPTKPTNSQSNSAKPSPSPYRGSTDPFAALDRGGSKSRGPVDELSNKFPTLDQFDILHEKGGKFEFEPSSVDSKPEDEHLSQRLTHALADDAFAKPSADRESTSKPVVNRRSQIPAAAESAKPTEQPSYRDKEDLPRQQAPLYQPVPRKPAMVSTGTMTSPSETPDLPERKPASKPVYRFPTSVDQEQRQSSGQQSWVVAEAEKKSSEPTLPPSPKPALPPRVSADRLNGPVPSSSRLSLDTARPPHLDVGDPLTRSKSANAKAHPVSVSAGSMKYELPRESESARSSLELSRNPYEGVLSQVRSEMDQDNDRANITSDVDYLRVKEEEEQNRKRDKRASGSSKHSKRTSLSTLSLSGTKTLFGSRFGDAFRRFEGGNHSKPESPVAEDSPKQPLTVTASEVTEPPDEEADQDENDDISPEMRRELERRRLSQEEKRVANAAVEYRRRVAERGEGGSRTVPDGGSRSAAIQNRVQNLMEDSNKPSPQKTASGYGRFTAEDSKPPALQAKPSELRSEPLERPGSGYVSRNPGPVYGAYTGGASSAFKETNVSSVSKVSTASTGYTAPTAQRTGPRPAAPPKPKNLRVDSDLASPSASHDRNPAVMKTPTSPSEDWEANFSRRYPSLSGLEMVETEIEISKVTSLRTKEV